MNKLIVANWKMYLTLIQSVTLAKKLLVHSSRFTDLKLVLCPSFVALEEVMKIVKSTRIKLGAQDVEPIRQGARTGEVGIDNLRELGVKYVLVGHSEKRRYQKETNELVNQKLKAALEAGMTPILCVGEPSRTPTTPNPSSGRRGNYSGQGAARRYVANQLRRGLKALPKKDIKRIIVAYEPVWAIGAKHPDTVEDAVDMHKWIRNIVNAPILYGGSVDSNNASKFLREKQIDGLLIGRASTSINSLRGILSSI